MRQVAPKILARPMNTSVEAKTGSVQLGLGIDSTTRPQSPKSNIGEDHKYYTAMAVWTECLDLTGENSF